MSAVARLMPRPPVKSHCIGWNLGTIVSESIPARVLSMKRNFSDPGRLYSSIIGWRSSCDVCVLRCLILLYDFNTNVEITTKKHKAYTAIKTQFVRSIPGRRGGSSCVHAIGSNLRGYRACGSSKCMSESIKYNEKLSQCSKKRIGIIVGCDQRPSRPEKR